MGVHHHISKVTTGTSVMGLLLNRSSNGLFVSRICYAEGVVRLLFDSLLYNRSLLLSIFLGGLTDQ